MTRFFYEGITRAIASITMLKNDNDSNQANRDNGDNGNNGDDCINDDNYDKHNIVGHTVFIP